jgi:lipopolysaccharide transport system ATP-binding protein
MYVRLAFAVAAHLEPEILLVDEVLAVGDASFQKKCLGKMSEVAGEGRTVLFVSHNVAAIQQLTTECLVLADGALVRHARTEEALVEYLALAGDALHDVDLDTAPRYDAALGHSARFQSARLVDHVAGAFAADQDPTFEVLIAINDALAALRISVAVYRFDSTPIGSAFGEDLPPPSLGRAAYRVSIPGLRLAPGRYYISLGVGRGNLATGFLDYDTVLETVHFEVLPPIIDGSTITTWSSNWGSIRLQPPEVRSIEVAIEPRDRAAKSTPNPLRRP